MKEGRPSKYDPAYCQQVIDHMAEGASLTSFAAEVSVARSTINEWMGEHPEFSEAVNTAKAKCASWWEKVNRSIAEKGGGTGSAQACALGLKNMARDDWVERSEIDLNVHDNLADTIAKRRAHAAEGRDNGESA